MPFEKPDWQKPTNTQRQPDCLRIRQSAMLSQPAFPSPAPGCSEPDAEFATIAMNPSVVHPLPSSARWLGYAGLVPFVVATAMVWLMPAADRAVAAFALTAYGATIASFLGAIHWGLAMRNPRDDAAMFHFIWGVVPSLMAWLALLLVPWVGLVLLAVLLCLCLAIDRATYGDFKVQYWLSLRLPLTLVATASCLLAAVGLAR